VTRSNGSLILQKTSAVVCALLLPLTSFPALAQGPPPPDGNYPQQQQPPQLLSPEQLDDLVAPVALYPDPLLSQVLAASTYPLEVVEADRWLQQNPNLRGAQLIEAAKQQPWDASVQALVAFPDAMALLNRDIRWTTDLGNAFLAQQADVMNAVQRMRARAQSNGRLQNTPQQVVTNDGQSDIQIQPADPQVVYVPVYNPSYIWGPPAYDPWPSLWYPGIGFGFGFGPACFLGSLFAGFLGFGGWGWGLNWLAHGLFLNAGFFGHFGFHGVGGFGPGFGGRVAWAHDASHRLGVPYSSRAVASRFNGRFEGGRFEGGRFNSSAFNSARSANAGRSFEGSRFNEGAARSNGGESRSFAGGSRRYESSNRGNEARSNEAMNRGSEFNNRAGSQGYRAPAQSYRGFSGSMSPSYRAAGPSARSNGFSASRGSSEHLSAPRAQAQHSSAPHSSGSHSSGGGHASGGGHSSGGGHGGGHSSGGGHHK